MACQTHMLTFDLAISKNKLQLKYKVLNKIYQMNFKYIHNKVTT